MKRVSSLLTAVFLTGVMYAQNDTMPAKPNNQPLIKDTTPGLRTDTTPAWRRDTLNWNKDSLKGHWNDSLNGGNLNTPDSITKNGNWNAGDSTNLNNPDLNKVDSSNLNPGSTQPQPGTVNPVPAEPAATENKTDSSAGMNNKDADRDTKGEADATKSTKTAKTKKIVSDRVMMKDGEMLVIKKGVETKLEKSITLPDGNVVTADGTVKMPDGNSVKLKDGEYIGINPKKVIKKTKKTKTK
jgi:hypothetical protein